MPAPLHLHIKTRVPFAAGIDWAEAGPDERLSTVATVFLIRQCQSA
jgi:hypothetical protein